MVRLDMDYMKNYIQEELKINNNYDTIFSLFVICLRQTRMTYLQLRMRVLENRARQLCLRFNNGGPFL